MLLQNDHLLSSLQAALAEELRHLCASLERMAELLIGDAHVAMSYMEQLQEFDLIVQYAGESAAVLDRLALGESPDDAVAPVRLTAVQDRLRAALDRAA